MIFNPKHSWCNFATDDDSEEIKQHENEIKQKLAILKNVSRGDK